MCIKKERQPFAKHIYIQPLCQCSFYISLSVAEGKSYFLNCSTASFPYMIAGNRDGIPFGQAGCTPFKNIGDDAHGGLWWIDIRTIQSDKIRLLKTKRDNAKAQECLDKISAHAKDGTNLMPVVIEAVENYCTLGEVADELRKVFGEYR